MQKRVHIKMRPIIRHDFFQAAKVELTVFSAKAFLVVEVEGSNDILLEN